jgi:hypothetical protein
MTAGRPTKYNPEIAQLICERVATHDVGLRRLTDMYDDLPDKVTINIWRRKHEEFRSQYAQAKREQIEFLTEDILEIADDSRNDFMESLKESEQGTAWRVNGDHINRCKLRVDTRKWLASKLAPKIYGDKLLNEVSASAVSVEEIAQRVAEINKQSEKDY